MTNAGLTRATGALVLALSVALLAAPAAGTQQHRRGGELVFRGTIVFTVLPGPKFSITRPCCKRGEPIYAGKYTLVFVDRTRRHGMLVSTIATGTTARFVGRSVARNQELKPRLHKWVCFPHRGPGRPEQGTFRVVPDPSPPPEPPPPPEAPVS